MEAFLKLVRSKSELEHEESQPVAELIGVTQRTRYARPTD